MQQARDGEAAQAATTGLRCVLAAAFTVALLAAAGAVRAADPGAPADAASGYTSSIAPSPPTLQEVIVYARRRAESIEDTPVAVTVRTGEELREESAVLVDDIGRDAPNVRMVASPQSVSALDVTIRGQTDIREAIFFDPAVGVYVDGVYVANGQGAMSTLLDIDSVEVLRGSQGTLFGRDNTGGSILLMTHRPDLGRADAEFALGAGDYGQFMDRAIVNLPLGSDFAIRLAYQGNDRSGFGSSLGSGQDNLENQHRYQARLGALWKSGDASEVYFTYERFEAREYGAILHPLEGPPPGTLVSQIGSALAQFQSFVPGLPTVVFPSNPYQTDGDFPGYDNATTDSVHLTATQGLGGEAVVKLIVGYRRVDATTALDVDASPLPLADTTLYNTSNEKSAELQLNDKALNDRLDWVGGLYWFRDTGGAPSVQAPASQQFLSALEQVSTLTGGMVNFLPLFGCPETPPAPCGPVTTYDQNSVINRSIAAYLHGEYLLTPDWGVAAGVRRTGDLRELEENDYVITPFGESCTIGGSNPALPCPPTDKSVSYGFWSWEFSSRYRLSPELNAYMRIGRSQRSGGWNSPLASLDEQPFKPEQLTDYELGLKADTLGGALRVNGDVFYGRYDSIQRLLAQLNAEGTPVTLVTNAGRARVSGAELEAQWRVTERASVLNSFGWTDARYQTFVYQPVPGGPEENLANNEFYQTPRLQGDFGGSYQIPTAAGDVLLRADYAWQDKVEFNAINDFNYQSAYGTANARVALADRMQAWELAVYCNNVADKRYAYTGGTLGEPLSPSPTIAWNVPGPRRFAGIEGTYRWNPPH